MHGQRWLPVIKFSSDTHRLAACITRRLVPEHILQRLGLHLSFQLLLVTLGPEMLQARHV